MMNTESRYYDVYPRVVPAGRRTAVTIRPTAAHAAWSDSEYEIALIPLDRTVDQADAKSLICGLDVPRFRVRPSGGRIVFSHTFPDEQEYAVRLCRGDDPQNAVEQFAVYSLREDLYRLFPYRVETHAHTCRSDGAESPEFVPAYYRMIGYDALAITDHYQYEPSLEAMEAFRDARMAFRLCPGEEIHGPYNPVHIVNFGGGASVNQMIRDNPGEYDEQVRRIMAATGAPDGADPYRIASCIWIGGRIREAGGLSVMGHPHWRRWHQGRLINYNISRETFLFLLESGAFDAWEICGASPEDNNTHLALYLEALSRGVCMPVLGANDSHGVVAHRQYFGKAYTVVFSRENSLEELIAGMRNGYCAAVEQTEKNGPYRVYAKPRMILYARFLLEYYFDFHDAYCAQEGVLMSGYAAGVPGAGRELERVSGRTGRFAEHFFRGEEFGY